jgi:hypothetical protein
MRGLTSRIHRLLFLIGLIIFSIRLFRHRSSRSRDPFTLHGFNNLNSVNVSNTPRNLGMEPKFSSNKPSTHSYHGAPPAYSPSQPYSGRGNGIYHA